MARNLAWHSLRTILRLVENKPLLNNVITRLTHTQEGYVPLTANFNNSDYQEMKSYQKFVEESKIGAGRAAITLIKTLDVTRENAVNAVTVWPIFATLSKSVIVENNKLLRAEGIDKSTLRENMYALANTPQDLNFKIKLLQTLDLDLNVIIPLFRLPRHLITKLITLTTLDTEVIPQKSRIHYLCEKFKYEPYPICEILCNHPQILFLSIVNVVSKTEYMLDAGISAEHILKDLTVYSYSLFTIKYRVERAKLAQINPLRPWVVRCPVRVLEEAEKRLSIKNDLFKSVSSLAEYISQVLGCDIASVQALLTRNPSIEKIYLAKMKNNLEFLHDCGYTIEDIYRAPRCLNCSHDTLRKKYETWMKHDIGKPRISTISGSKKLFDEKLAHALAQKS